MNLEIRTQHKNSRHFDYKGNLREVITFLGHSEDKIRVSESAESTNIEIYQNGEPLFLGDKYELFEILKNHTKK
jgi:hypothetical protein